MDMRMLSYLERRMRDETHDESRSEQMENRRGVSNRRRNRIGFADSTESPRNEMRSHKDYDFEEDDFKEPKYFGKSEKQDDNQSMDELIELMEKSFKKELCDVLRYCKMAEIAEEEGLVDIAEGLKALSNDKFTHAKFFRMGLRHFGEEAEKAEPELNKLWQKVSRKMEES